MPSTRDSKSSEKRRAWTYAWEETMRNGIMSKKVRNPISPCAILPNSPTALE